MPFALAIIGIIFMATAVKGTTTQFFSLVMSDFTGSGNYIYWVISILIIGSVGYIKKLQPVSDLFLALVLIVMFLANKGGFFSEFTSAIKSGSAGCPASTTNANDIGNLSGTIGNLFSANAAANPTATYQPGQSLQQQLNNMETNLNSAFGQSSTLGGG
jgi:hypothetical protein